MQRVVLIASLFTLSSCGGGAVVSPPAAGLDLAGQYAGTGTDSILGSARATTTLSESGSTLSGTIVFVSSATGATLSQAVTWTIGPSYAISGTTKFTGGSCTFSSTGAYDTSTNALAGTYTATSGCAGETGTFTLVQQCTNPITADRKRFTRPTSC
jgi:hypothetical protein